MTRRNPFFDGMGGGKRTTRRTGQKGKRCIPCGH